jgi:subtilisin family serine protease
VTDVIVGVIDSGWDRTIPNSRVLAGIGVIDACGNVLTCTSTDDHDRLGHGTICTQILLQASPAVKALPIRVFGDKLETNLDAVTSALDWAIEADLPIVNLSIGTHRTELCISLYAACERARQAGLIIVAAAANTGRHNVFPASFDNVIGVRHLNFRDSQKILYQENELGECAVQCRGRVVRGLYSDSIPVYGTSAGTPLVTALVASIFQSHGRMPLDGVRKFLKLSRSSNSRPTSDQLRK